MARIECPECGRPADDQDFACSHCELILNAEAPAGRYVLTNPSIVRALISPPDYHSGHDQEIPKPPPRDATTDDQVTVVRRVMLSGEEVPRLVAGLDVALAPLHPFEAYVVSLFDGATSANDAAAAAQLRRVEMNAVLSSLVERKVVVLEQPRPAPAATPRPPAPAPARAVTPPQVPLAAVRPVRIASRTAIPALRPEPKPEPKPEPAAAPAPVPQPRARRVPLDTVGPQDAVKNALTRALAMEKRGQVDGAIEVLKLGISKLDKPASLYNKLALILLDQRRDFAQAEELLQKALEIEPENTIYQQNLFRVISRAAAAGSSGSKKSPSGFLAKLWKK